MASSTEDPRQPGTGGKRREFPALTGLRIVAALWVVLYHVAGNLSASYERHLQPLWPVLRSGWLGVDLFFILSGFVVTSAYLSRMGDRLRLRGSAEFLWARFARVWPVWALVSAVFMVVLLVTGDPDRPDSYSAPVTSTNTLEQMLMVQVWSSDRLARTSYVVPGWSLSAEWLAYVCFPLIAVVLFRFHRLPWWALATASTVAMTPFAYWNYAWGEAQDLWQVRIAFGFLAGALMAMAVARLPLTSRAERLAGVVSVGVLAEMLVIFWWSAAQGPVSRSGLAVVAFPALVGALAVSRTGLARALSTPVMQLGGRISYSLYLVHTCVFLVFESIARESARLAPGGVLYGLLLPHVVLLTIPLSYLLWRYVEEPSRQRVMRHCPWPKAVVPKSVPVEHRQQSPAQLAPLGS